MSKLLLTMSVNMDSIYKLLKSDEVFDRLLTTVCFPRDQGRIDVNNIDLVDVDEVVGDNHFYLTSAYIFAHSLYINNKTLESYKSLHY